MKRIAMNFLVVISFLLMTVSAFPYSIEIERGIDYITCTQNQTGRWGNTDASINNEYFSTFAVIDALKLLGQENTAVYQNAIQWLQAENLANSAYIANKISILANSGADLSSDISTLLSYKNADNGWGGYAKYRSSNFHSALVHAMS